MDAAVDTNLTKALREKHINVTAVRTVIGVKQDKTAREKLKRLRPFNLPEAKKLHRNLLPEYDFDYLFDEYVDYVDSEAKEE